MRTIPEFLDLAKKVSGIKSDRELGRMIHIKNMAPYRTRSVIPDDMTAIRIAALCELPAAEVLITCHLLKAAAGEHPETHGLWKDVLKMVSNACIVLGALSVMTLSPTPATAGSAASVHPSRQHIIHYATFIMAALLLSFIFLIKGDK